MSAANQTEKKGRWDKRSGNGHYFIFTCFPPRPVTESDFKGTATTRYLKVTNEECSKTGRAHVHIFYYTSQKATWNSVRQWMLDMFRNMRQLLPLTEQELKTMSGCDLQELKTLKHVQNCYNYVGKEYTQNEDYPVFEVNA